MKILFAVQGDGRGHMTQAIAAARLLHSHGHEIVAITVGANPSRTVPAFFSREFGERLSPIASPGFCFQHGKGVSGLGTIRQAVAGAGKYRASLATLGGLIEQTKPDLVLNFLEPLVGLLNLLQPHSVPVISVGHQFMLGHPEFVRSRRFALQQWSMRRYVGLVGARSTKLALSFYPATPLPRRDLFVCPPLLRQEVFELEPESSGRFLLAYVLNQGYTDEIIRWHRAHPEVEVHCFCEKPKVEPVWRFDSTLWFHKLDGVKFLRMMAESRGVACTAGFESLNEAAWLGKPLLVVPVGNHVEQHLNALDAQQAGLAVAAESFDLTPLLQARPAANLAGYRNWVRRTECVLLSVMEVVLRRSVRRVPALADGPLWRPSGAPESNSGGRWPGRPPRAALVREAVGHC